jgi:hypothetical protein
MIFTTKKVFDEMIKQFSFKIKALSYIFESIISSKIKGFGFIMPFVCTQFSIFCLMIAFSAIACQSEVESPPPPKAPDIKTDAKNLLMPKGQLTQEKLSDLSNWIKQDANLFVLISPVITEILIDLVKNVVTGEDDEKTEMEMMMTQTQQGSSQTQQASSQTQQASSQSQGILGSLQSTFSGGGWFKLTLACNRLEAILNQNQAISTQDQGKITLYATFDSLKIVPVIWGNADQCNMKISNYHLKLDADFSFFLPSDHLLIDDDWTLTKNQWVNFNGIAMIDQSQYQGDQKIMVDQDHWVWLLWENSSDKFAITKAPDLQDFSIFVVATESGIWDCDFLESKCVHRDSQEQLSW